MFASELSVRGVALYIVRLASLELHLQRYVSFGREGIYGDLLALQMNNEVRVRGDSVPAGMRDGPCA